MIDRFNVLVQHTAAARARARERLMGSIGGDASARAVSRDEDALAARARAQAEVAALVDTVARRERGHLRHQLARPLALAKEEDACVHTLDVVRAVDPSRLPPYDQVDAVGVV